MKIATRLQPHPENQSAVVHAITVRIDRAPDGFLTLAYDIAGDLAKLRIAQPRPPRFAEGLWRHTCCEIFIATKGLPAYHEFNFSPSGEWAAYAFAKYRQGGPLPQLAPTIDLHTATEKMELCAVVPLQFQKPLSIGLSAVIENRDGALSYWALRHPPGKPDFHHPDAFALELA